MKKKESYMDFQFSFIPDLHDYPIIGIGVGKIHSAENTGFRLKAFTWGLLCLAIDYDRINRLSFSAIPVIPIGNY